jgi:hypothetical protein
MNLAAEAPEWGVNGFVGSERGVGAPVRRTLVDR